jgi:hypothetical protein
MEQQTSPQAHFEPDEQPFFSHEPLLTICNVVRLLTLGLGQDNDKLQESLVVERLDSVVEFEALSYVWSPKNPNNCCFWMAKSSTSDPTFIHSCAA